MLSAFQTLTSPVDPRWWLAFRRGSASLISKRRYRPKVEALEELVVPSSVVPVSLSPVSAVKTLVSVDAVRPAAVASARRFDGVYRATLVGKVTTSSGTEAIRGSFVFRADNGVITSTANGRRLPGSINSIGEVRLRFVDQGMNVQINGLVKIVNGVPRMSGTWTTTGTAASGRGTWTALRSSVKVDLAGRWLMSGVQTNVARSNWQGDLRLNADGTLRWMETRGANVGAVRVGRWTYDGKTFKMHWWAPKVGRVEWEANSVTRTVMSGSYRTPMAGPQPVGWGGTWSARKVI